RRLRDRATQRRTIADQARVDRPARGRGPRGRSAARSRGHADDMRKAVPATLALVALFSWPASADALGPYPDLGSCQVFPDPPAATSPRSPLAPQRGRLNPSHLEAPHGPDPTRAHPLHHPPWRHLPPPRLGPPPPLRLPLRGGRRRAAQAARPLHR